MRVLQKMNIDIALKSYDWKLRSTMTRMEKIVNKPLKTKSCYHKNQIMSQYDNKEHAIDLKLFIEKKKKNFSYKTQ